MAFKYNITIDQGTDVEIDVNLEDLGLNASSYSFRGGMRKHYDADSQVAFGFHTVSNSQITFGMNAVVSGNLDPGVYVYDIEAISATNTVSRIMEGMARVKPSAYQP